MQQDARQNVMLGEPAAIIDNPQGFGELDFGGVAGASTQDVYRTGVRA
jgi:hypothetical protein